MNQLQSNICSASLSAVSSAAIASESLMDAIPSLHQLSIHDSNANTSTHTTATAAHSQPYYSSKTEHQHHQTQQEESGLLGWLHSQQRKRQKQALEKAVEEQRRILLQETQYLEENNDHNYNHQHHHHNTNSNPNTNNTNNSVNNCNSKMIQQKEEMVVHNMKDRQLSDNPTFKSMTNQYPHQSVAGAVLSGIPLCYASNDSDDDNEEYVVDTGTDTDPDTDTGNCSYHESGRPTTAAGEGEETVVVLANPQDTHEIPTEETDVHPNAFAFEYQSVMTAQSRSNHTSISTEMYSCTAGSSQDEDAFRIRTPCATDAGGLTVQLDFLEKQQAKKQFQRDPKDMVKVFEERNCTEDIPFLLTLEQMTVIAENGLPPSMMFSRWKRIYSLQRDGDSFDSAFLKKVRGHERTLLVVQTTRREVMGAFSNSAWKGHGPSASAHFYGSAQASLFSIDKKTDEVLVHKWTGKNRYIQVCDMQHKLIALGGGGKDGEFGLCVEDDFRIGSTGPCETFGNARLCSQDQFEIMNVECWGFISGFC